MSHQIHIEDLYRHEASQLLASSTGASGTKKLYIKVQATANPEGWYEVMQGDTIKYKGGYISQAIYTYNSL